MRIVVVGFFIAIKCVVTIVKKKFKKIKIKNKIVCYVSLTISVYWHSIPQIESKRNIFAVLDRHHTQNKTTNRNSQYCIWNAYRMRCRHFQYIWVVFIKTTIATKRQLIPIYSTPDCWHFRFGPVFFSPLSISVLRSESFHNPFHIPDSVKIIYAEFIMNTVLLENGIHFWWSFRFILTNY